MRVDQRGVLHESDISQFAEIVMDYPAVAPVQGAREARKIVVTCYMTYCKTLSDLSISETFSSKVLSLFATSPTQINYI